MNHDGPMTGPSALELIERNNALTRELEFLRREVTLRERSGFECVRRATHLAAGPDWLNAVDPLGPDDKPAFDLCPAPDRTALLIVDTRFDGPRVVATIEFNKDGCEPNLRAATHKQRVWLLARLALRAEV